jgi:hypothetical protein
VGSVRQRALVAKIDADTAGLADPAALIARVLLVG